MNIDRNYVYRDGRRRRENQIDEKYANYLFELLFAKFYGFESYQNDLDDRDKCMVRKVQSKLFQSEIEGTQGEARIATEYKIIDYVLFQVAYCWSKRTWLKGQIQFMWIFSTPALNRWEENHGDSSRRVEEMLWVFNLDREKIHGLNLWRINY